ncbi:efflux RND transporter periplasmic adaptor subunit [Thermocrinis minervae]|uniref:Membrane fusion protein, Cu(I)/Ag(I) efflux system n=1 Tax=Thermocrinis minervae TaxID=381751 RepID=A0A1M6R593_9AQUI|nr:efflux RND transporter periplasmic adaptor subunit [Thermocrinis minervae]SHK27624.1 membrane fusion protein, Cu(I)/Ag(I) efflux system [Thermocrinis minervae]
MKCCENGGNTSTKKWVFLTLMILVIALGSLFVYQQLKHRTADQSLGTPLFTLEDQGVKVEVFSKKGSIDVGKQDLTIRVSGGDLKSLYLYMPPMPGMGEMREDATIQKVSDGVYNATLNVSMAGSWQLFVQVDGKVLKKDISVPFAGQRTAVDDQSQIVVNTKAMQLIGIQTHEVSYMDLSESFSVVGYVSYDLSHVHQITLRSDAWVLDTFSRFEGELVKRGTPLMKVLSPEVRIAQEELNLAKSLGRQDIERLSKEKLSYLHAGQVVTSPVNGLILEKKVNPGGFLKAGEVAYTLVDLSNLWVVAEVPLEFSSYLKKGMKVLVKPVGEEKLYEGRVDYIFPVADKEARTVKARISLRGASLKINQLVEVIFETQPVRVLAVPESAVVDTGRRQVVFVQKGEGMYEPRQIKLGRRFQDYYEVLDGLSEGERVVVKGTFFLDSEAQIKGLYGGEEKSHEHHHH